MQRGRKNRGSPLTKAASKTPFDSTMTAGESALGSSVLTGSSDRVHTNNGRQVLDEPPGPTAPPSSSPAFGVSHPIHLVLNNGAW